MRHDRPACRPPRYRSMARTFGSGQFEWKRRRRLIYATLAFCLVSAIAILIGALRGLDTPLLSTLALAVFGLAGSTIGTYVFGAVWDDNGARQAQIDAEPEPDPEEKEA